MGFDGNLYIINKTFNQQDFYFKMYGDEPTLFDFSELIEVCYWRKRYDVHNWFKIKCFGKNNEDDENFTYWVFTKEILEDFSIFLLEELQMYEDRKYLESINKILKETDFNNQTILYHGG